MSRKRTTKTMLFVLVLLAFASLVHAEEGWHVVSIATVGIGWDSCYVVITDAENVPPLFTGLTYKLRTEKMKELMAIALTAKANNMKLRTLIDPDLPVSDINVLYLVD